MSTTNQTSGRQQEFHRRRVGPNTLVTADNRGLLLERKTLVSITNCISKQTHARFKGGEVISLVEFISDLPPEQFYNKSLEDAENKIANMFVNRRDVMRKSGRPAQAIGVLSGTDEVSPDATIDDYLTEEVMQTTHNENQYKYSTHAERRGNSIIDRDRVNGHRSSPNNIPSGHSQNVDIARVLAPLSQFFDPKNIDEIFSRAISSVPGVQTFQNITFPHRTIPLDSRNRILAHNRSNQIKFNLHSAGQPGRLGDIRIQDTLQEIIEVRICPFWLPVNNPMDDYYSTVRVGIEEFWQRAEVTEFLDANESVPTNYGYHFEFEITRRDKNRVYLVPVCSTYKFHKPIARVETLTLNFRSPFRPVTIESDRGTYTMTYSDNVGDPTTFTLTDGSEHGLSTGDLIYMLNANSGSLLDDELNREDGHIVTRINDTEFTIESDTNAVAPGTETGRTVLYGSKRIIIQLEFTSLER